MRYDSCGRPTSCTTGCILYTSLKGTNAARGGQSMNITVGVHGEEFYLQPSTILPETV